MTADFCKSVGCFISRQPHMSRHPLVGHGILRCQLGKGGVQALDQDNLGQQQGAEDAEWPSLVRAEGTQQPSAATSLEETLGSQPQRSPTSATDCDSDPSGLTEIYHLFSLTQDALLLHLLLRSSAISLGFTILREIFFVCDHF